MIGQQAQSTNQKHSKNAATPFADSLIAMENVNKARAIYLKDYKAHQGVVEELIQILDASNQKFNTTHYRADDIFLIQFTHTSICVKIIHKYLHQLSTGFVRLYVKRFQHEIHARKKLMQQLKVKLEAGGEDEPKMEAEWRSIKWICTYKTFCYSTN